MYYICDYCGTNEYYDKEPDDEGDILGWIRMFEDEKGKTICAECLCQKGIYFDWWEVSQTGRNDNYYV